MATIDQEKVKSIIEWPTPRNFFEVINFHGLSIFYRKIIRNFSRICAPIVETIKGKKQLFQWTKEYKKSFQLIKKKIIEQLIQVSTIFS